MEIILHLILVAFLGLIVGIASTMFGIGGGIVMVPMLHLFFDVVPRIAAGTSLCATLPTSLAGVWNRRKSHEANIKAGLIIGCVGACISPLGATMATYLPGWILTVCTALIIFWMAARTFLKARASSSVHDRHKTIRQPIQGVIPFILSGIVAGLASGFLGLGGGFIIVPILSHCLGFTMKQATATSLISVALLGIPGCIMHAYFGNIQYMLALGFIVGSIPGTKVGAILVEKFSNKALSYAFAAALSVCAIILILREMAF